MYIIVYVCPLQYMVGEGGTPGLFFLLNGIPFLSVCFSKKISVNLYHAFIFYCKNMGNEPSTIQLRSPPAENA